MVYLADTAGCTHRSAACATHCAHCRRWEYLLPVTSMLPEQVLAASTAESVSNFLGRQPDVADDDATVMEEGQWTYRVSDKLSARFDLRAWPATKASKTGSFVHQGDVLVVDARLVLDGILFLHVATTASSRSQNLERGCTDRTEATSERPSSSEGYAGTQSAGRGGWIFDRTQGGGSGICSAPGAQVLLTELNGITHRVKLVGGQRTANCCADPVAVARSVRLTALPAGSCSFYRLLVSLELGCVENSV